MQPVLGQVGRERDIFVAAHAVGQLVTELLFQLVRHLAQHDVAGLMPHGVVQLVQAVDVHVNAAERAPAAAGNIVLLAFEGVSIAQTGGLVVFRNVAEPGAGDEILHHHVHDIGRGDDRDAAVYDAVEHIDLDDPRVLAGGYKEKKQHIPDDDAAHVFERRHDEQRGKCEQKDDECGCRSARTGHGAEIDAERIQRAQKQRKTDLQTDSAAPSDIKRDRKQKAGNAEHDEIGREVGREHNAENRIDGGNQKKDDADREKRDKPVVIVEMHLLLDLGEFFRSCSGVEKQALDFFHIQYQPFGSEMNAREKYCLNTLYHKTEA